MYEDDYRRRTNLHRSGRTSEKPKKSSFGITGFQAAVCALCIAVAVIIRLVGGGVYSTVRDSVSKALDTQVTGSDVKSVFAAIKSGLPDVSSVFDSSVGNSTSASSQAASTTSSSSSSSNTSSSASTASATASKTSSSASASKTASQTGVKAVETAATDNA